EHEPPLRATRMRCGPASGLGVMPVVKVGDELAPCRVGVEEAGVEGGRPFLGRLRGALSPASPLVPRLRGPSPQPSEEPRQWPGARVLGRQRLESVEAVPEILLEQDAGSGTTAAQGRGADLRLQGGTQTAPARLLHEIPRVRREKEFGEIPALEPRDGAPTSAGALRGAHLGVKLARVEQVE